MKNKLNFIIENENTNDTIEAIKKKVKHGKLKVQKKKVKAAVLKKHRPEDHKRNKILKAARKKAHGSVPDTKRNISNKMRKNLSTLSENFDFIEESYGSGILDVSFYESPQDSTTISENFASGENNFKTIGIAEGIFAPIGTMSRNGRKYDNDHYPYILENQNMVNKIQNRGMLGTIGHHDKKVDDEDLACGMVSHIVTNLEVVTEEDGTQNLYGKLEILDTPAGNLLKTYYESGIPLYVSSRGAGKLLQVANENYKRVDKTSYFLETFDIVKEPGFLQAKPNYLGESKEDIVEDNNNEEENMKSKVTKETVIKEEAMEAKVAITPDMEVEEVVKRLTNPLNEKIEALTEAVRALTDKLVEEVSESEEKEDEEKEETKKEEAEEEKEEKEEVSESVEEVTEEAVEAVEEVTEEAVEAVEEVTEEFVTPKKDEKTESQEEKAAPVAAELATKPAEPSAQLVEEVTEDDYKTKYEECETVVEQLLELVQDLSNKAKISAEKRVEIQERLNTIEKELNEYKLCEEFGLTKEEAKAKLQDKDYGSIKEELTPKAEEVTEEAVEEVTEEVTEETVEEVTEEVTEETVEEVTEEVEIDESEKEAQEIAEKISEEFVEIVSEETKPSKRAFSIFNTNESNSDKKPKKAFSIFS